MALVRCPTCGADLGGGSVCRQCGTLASLEFRLARAKGGAQAYLQKKLSILPGRLEMHHFLWACAVMPIFILPPLVSFAFAMFSLQRSDSRVANVNFEWLAIISVLNVILSILILFKFHAVLNELIASEFQQLRDFLDSRFRFAPIQPAPKPIPI